MTTRQRSSRTWCHMELPAATKPTNANFVRVIRKKCSMNQGCHKRFYRHMFFRIIYFFPFETSATASCGFLGIRGSGIHHSNDVDMRINTPILACIPEISQFTPKNRQSQKETHLPTIIFQGRDVKFRVFFTFCTSKSLLDLYFHKTPGGTRGNPITGISMEDVDWFKAFGLHVP